MKKSICIYFAVSALISVNAVAKTPIIADSVNVTLYSIAADGSKKIYHDYSSAVPTGVNEGQVVESPFKEKGMPVTVDISKMVSFVSTAECVDGEEKRCNVASDQVRAGFNFTYQVREVAGGDKTKVVLDVKSKYTELLEVRKMEVPGCDGQFVELPELATKQTSFSAIVKKGAVYTYPMSAETCPQAVSKAPNPWGAEEKKCEKMFFDIKVS